MRTPHVLVAGATGQIGSHVIGILAAKGITVRALVRRPDDRIKGIKGEIEYTVGALEDKPSLEKALVGIDTVISSANAVIPSGKNVTVKDISERGYENFISAAEAAGVRQWVQSSVPAADARTDASVPEIAGKRFIERRLEASPIAHTIVRNPAFTDVWLIMIGAGNAANDDPHATTSRPFGFMKMWQKMTGNLVARHGIMLAPGGRNHGSPLITVEDVAQIMAGVVGKQAAYNRTIESGGPEWLTWTQVAELLSEKAGRKVRVVSMPAWFAAMGQAMMTPVWPSAAGVLGLVKFVSRYQPDWKSAPVVAEFDLPHQTTVAEYLDRHWKA